MIQIIDSITSLVNGASCVVKDNSEIIWTDSRPQPTDAEIQAEVTRLQTEYDNNQYQRDRNYAPTGDQLDMLWHSIDAGEFGDTAKQSEFYTANKAVKDANPKP
jgi:hypothetical protein